MIPARIGPGVDFVRTSILVERQSSPGKMHLRNAEPLEEDHGRNYYRSCQSR